MTIEEIQQEVIEEFEGFDDWMDKYQMLIDLGSEQEPLPEQYKVESNLIDGCQSRVWLQADLTPEGKIHFQAESDALIVKGIVTLLIRVPQQWSARHAQADETLCDGIQGKAGFMTRNSE